MSNRETGHAGPEGKEPQGITRPAQGPAQEPQPRMQYERDQSSDEQSSEEPSQRRMGEIAHDDIERGVQDTSKGEALDETYQKTRKSAPNPKRKFSP
jgi:hypothetical protein